MMKILVLNAGSSSQKSCLYDLTGDTLPQEAPHPLWEAKIDWTHHQGMAEIEVKTHTGVKVETQVEATDRPDAIAQMLDTLCQGDTQVIESLSEINGVGHRVVHGGQDYRNSVIITPEVKSAIADLATFAPVHNPANLEGIEAVEQALGEVPQVAVFDTAFHAQLPLKAAVYPLPYEWFEQGIRRYGFHGISHQYCAQRAAHLLQNDLNGLRLITCHLGNGCSLAAIKNGQSIETTMGFTPLEGLMMGSRCGSIDPGILIHLMRDRNYTPEELDRILNKASGLQGVSGISSDMRGINEAIAQGNERAQLAIDIYIHRLQSAIASLLPSLGGLDVLVFTAGVGENSPVVRDRTCAGLAFLGVKLDRQKNQNSPRDCEISTPDSTVRVLAIHTEEDWAIAQECWHLLEKSAEC